MWSKNMVFILKGLKKYPLSVIGLKRVMLPLTTKLTFLLILGTVLIWHS